MTRATPADAKVRGADARAIAEAAARLVRGELVAFPTETVYGLGADAANERAVAAIYRLKGRPADHPLIVHVPDAARAAWWGCWSARAQRLADAFWPGPLTLVLARRRDAPGHACAGQASIGLRAPAHPVARALLAAFAAAGGRGIAAPSANRFGRVSPTTAAHVIEDLGADAPMVLDGGPCRVGVESTIVDLTRDRPVLLRPGGIDSARLESVLGETLLARDAGAPRASGTLDAHYAPTTPVELVTRSGLRAGIARLHACGVRVAAWTRSADGAAADVHLPMPRRAVTAARTLYGTLRALDRCGCDRILIERVPAGVAWRAVADRLERAAAQFSDPGAGSSAADAGSGAAAPARSSPG